MWLNLKKEIKLMNRNDIWDELYAAAKSEYHPEDVSPFIRAHHVVAAIEI